MTECPICALLFPGNLCPNQWREVRGEMTERTAEQHEAARVSITQFRADRARFGLG